MHVKGTSLDEFWVLSRQMNYKSPKECQVPYIDYGSTAKKDMS